MRVVSRLVTRLKAQNGAPLKCQIRHSIRRHNAGFIGLYGSSHAFSTNVRDDRAYTLDESVDKDSSAEILSPKVGEVVNLTTYVNSIRSTLKPPVANRMLYDSSQFKVMIVGGPNQRDDFHIEAGEEFFLQLEGEMALDVMQQGQRTPIPIKQSQVYVLPAHVPHSPQRYANSIGLVIERTRLPTELDTLRWYKKHTNEIEFEEPFYCTDLGSQIKEVIEKQIEMSALVKSQGLAIQTLPSDAEPPLHTPIPLDVTAMCASASSTGTRAHKWLDSEFRIHVYRGTSGPTSMPLEQVGGGETFLYQVSGTSTISSVTEDMALTASDVVLLGSHLPYDVQVGPDDVLIGISNKVTPL